MAVRENAAEESLTTGTCAMNDATDEDVRSVFAKSKTDLKRAVEYAILISNGMHGTQTDTTGVLMSDLLGRSITAGLTLELLLRPPQWTGYKGMPPNFSIWDYSSLCVIARGILETYLTLFYFGEQVSPVEREFRKLWWDWHHAHKRSIMATKAKINPAKRKGFEDTETQFRQKVLGHQGFQVLLGKKLQTDFLAVQEIQEALIHKKADIAGRAGMNANQYAYLYRMLSQHVHSQPFAVSSLRVAKAADEDDIDHLGFVAQYSTAFLVCSASTFIHTFPAARQFVDAGFAYMEALNKGILNHDMGSQST